MIVNLIQILKETLFVSYSCGTSSQKSSECRKGKDKRWCNFCKSNTHSDRTCRKLKHQTNNIVTIPNTLML